MPARAGRSRSWPFRYTPLSRLVPFLDLFVGYLHAERGLAVRTVEAYARDLSEYLRGLSAEGVETLEGISEAHVRGHLDALGARSRAEAAREARRDRENDNRRADGARAATERQGFEPWDQVITQSTA